MISITGTVRVFLFDKPVDMRKGFEGLSSLVEQQFEDDLVSGSYFAFLNRKRDRIKVLYWDSSFATAVYCDAKRDLGNGEHFCG